MLNFSYFKGKKRLIVMLIVQKVMRVPFDLDKERLY